MAKIVDLAAIALLALSLPAAVIVAWRRRDLAANAARSPLLAVLLSLLVCHPFALDPRYSAWRVLQWLAYVAVYVVAQAVSRRWVERAADWIVWAAALVVMAEAVTTGERAGTWLQGNPNTAAALLLQWLWLAPDFTRLAGSVALIATGSRGAVLGGIVAALGIFDVKQTFKVALLVVIVVGGLGLAASRLSTVENRLATWAEAGRLFLARPLVGWGPGCYPLLARADPGRPHADSFIMTIAAEQGVIGLAAWGWLLLWSARAVIRSDDTARLGMVACAVHNLVDYTLFWYWPGIAIIVTLAITTGGIDDGE